MSDLRRAPAEPAATVSSAAAASSMPPRSDDIEAAPGTTAAAAASGPLTFSAREWHAMTRGMNCSMYQGMGAHLREQDGQHGVHFAVWAPNAQEVCVVNDANGWSHGAFFLNGTDEGVWWGFVPGMQAGETYKYSIRTHTGELIQKADPYAFASERPPATASIVADIWNFEWSDDEWMAARRSQPTNDRAMTIYEIHLPSWRRPWDERTYLTYDEIADQLIPYAQDMGFTHLQLMPITEFPFDGSWGYQCTQYFAPTSRHGSPADFARFVDRCHAAGLGVLLDWVPGHFPSDPHSLARFDGTALFEHADPRQGYHPDWNTYIFNYGRHEVRDFLLSSARFWLDRYHIDGLRVDAVASMLYLDYSRPAGEWIPNPHGGRENLEAIQFLKDLNTAVHAEFPGVLTIAEESTSWPGVSRPVYDGGLGFDLKWDMGWMNDTLRYLHREPVHRQHHQNELSFRMVYAFHEKFVLPLSHDEVVHGKGSLIGQMPGDDWQKFANLRLLLGYQYTTPGKPLLFMGGELAQWKEWNHDTQLNWELLEHESHRGIQNFVRDLNRLTLEHPALHQRDFDAAGFRWIQADDAAGSTYAWVRYSADGRSPIVCVLNFTPVPREDYRLGVPQSGYYREILNSDAELYGGTNVGNAGGGPADDQPCHGFEHCLTITLPPLGMVLLQAEG